MKIVKVLYLDLRTGYLPDLTNEHKIRLKVTHKAPGYGPTEGYYILPGTCEAIQKLTENHEVDLVIIGNNNDIGIAQAMHVAPDMREKTIVVWNLFRPGIEQAYAKMGFRHFCSRQNLRTLLPKILTAA